MGTALNVSAWSTTAASNDGADSTIGTVSNNSAPNTVDDWVRGIMASVKRYILDTDGGITAGGTANALIITTNRAISSGHQAAGFSVRFKASNTNTGATTVNVDSLGAKSIKRLNGDDLAAGDIVSGGIYDIAFDGTNYVLLTGGAGSGLYGTLSGDNTWSGANTFTGAVHIGNADTTLSRVAAGLIAVEGKTIEPGASRASFSAHKNGSNQSISSTSPTQVTFGTEVFDVGSYFSSSAWTPPSGTVIMTAGVQSSLLTDGSDFKLYIYKNGSVFKGVVGQVGSSLGMSLFINVVDQCNGSDSYTVRVESASDSSYTILGASTSTFFSGSMV